MRLPNFLGFEPLNRLKDRMGVPRDVLGSVAPLKVDPYKASHDEIRQLAEDGLEIDIGKLSVLDDQTLSYKDRRVLLYIRDISSYGGKYSEPRFHLANCSTLAQMRANSRFGKYVISNRTDGVFTLLLIDSKRKLQKELDVCQNCLDLLRYDDFSLTHPSARRHRVVASFSVSCFFEKYPKTLHHSEPAYGSDTAPENDYPKDFASISRAYREKQQWKCEDCTISLAEPHLRGFLHVHHINGLKNECNEENLRALCVRCHARQPAHTHMKNGVWREFQLIWNEWNAHQLRSGAPVQPREPQMASSRG